MTTTNDTLRLTTVIIEDRDGAMHTSTIYGAIHIAAEIVRRCNDYPALAARLERAMRLLHCFVDAERFSGRGSFPMCSDAAALLAEHEKEARP